MENVNRTVVEIFGQSYTILGEESEEQVQIVSRTIDHKMKKLSEVAPLMNSTSLAVLAAVNLTNGSIKLEREVLELQEKNVQINYEVQQKEDQLFKLTNEFESLKTVLSSKESKIEELESFTASLKQAQTRIPKLEEEVSKSINKNNLVSEQNVKLKEELLLKNSELEKQVEIVADCNREIAELKTENTNLNKDFASEVSRLENEVLKSNQSFEGFESLEQELSNSKKRITELEFEIEYLQLEKAENTGNNSISDNSDKTKELEKLSADLSSEIKLHKNTIKELERKLASQGENSTDENLIKLQQRNSELEKEVEYLNGELPERQERINELEQEVDYLKYEAPLKMQNRIDDLENELKHLKSETVF